MLFFSNRNIDDITSAERTVLLSKADSNIQTNSGSKSDQSDNNNENESNISSCKIKINSTPKYSTAHIMLVCDCSKIELFTGNYEEYIKTCDGELLDEFDGVKSYIFEIYLMKKVSNVCLKVNQLRKKRPYYFCCIFFFF